MTRSSMLIALAALGFVTPIFPAAAQTGIGGGNPMNQLRMPERQEDPRVLERRDAVDREYRATKGSLPPQSGPVDPWANMRGAEEIKPAAKPAQKQSATAPKKKPPQ